MLMRGIFPVTHKRSSAIVGLGHDRRSLTLAVRWRSGRVSFHYGVPRGMFAEFLSAESLGKFFWQRVRGKFRKEWRSKCGDVAEGANARGCVQSAPGTKSPILIVPAARGARSEIHARG